nr:phosphotransferase [Oceanobacillus halotolerans]
MIETILNQYGVYTKEVKTVTDRLYQVSDGNAVYALKKSSLSNSEIDNWKRVYDQAYSSHLIDVLPLYLTKDRELYTYGDQSIWYLTPWVDSQQVTKQQAIENIYRSIGNIHAITKQSLSMDPKHSAQQFKQYHSYCLEMHSMLIGYVEKFESEPYMSPFGLQVCTHYRDLEFVFYELINHLTGFMELLEEQTRWSFSLCHGQLQFSHVLHHQHTSIINWENAFFGNACIDLSRFIKEECKYHDQPGEALIDLFDIYTKENNLSKIELRLLAIYLLDPTDYINLIKQYDSGDFSTTIDHMKELVHTYRQLLLAIKFSQKFNDMIEPSFLDESLES